MTARAKLAAEEQRQALFAAVNWFCVVCGGPLHAHSTAQLAHRVPKSKSMVEKWGADVIHNSLNLVPVCQLKCNDRVSLGAVSLPARDLLARIVRITTGRESMPNLADYYAELRAEFAQN